MEPLTWVIGRGGLLGRNVEAASAGVGPTWRSAGQIPWSGDRAGDVLESEVDRFLRQVARHGLPWRIFWCAGAGVVATSADVLEAETALVARAVEAIVRHVAANPALAGSGALFFASSAGGVYAASAASPPFDESSPVEALAPYGRAKLRQEGLFAMLSERCGVDVVLGRLSNLYGPGQNMAKPQGLVAQVGWAALRRQPISIYVSLDTVRDYLFAADAGRMIVAAAECRASERAAGAEARATVKIFAAEDETTVASVLGMWRQALRRPLRVSLATSPVAELQPRVLSFRSSLWSHVRGRPTILPLGIDALRRDQLMRLTAGVPR